VIKIWKYSACACSWKLGLNFREYLSNSGSFTHCITMVMDRCKRVLYVGHYWRLV